MRLIDADALIGELQKDEERFDKEAEDCRKNSRNYTDCYMQAMSSRADGIRDAIIEVYDAPTIDLTDRLDEAYACGYTDAEAKFYNPVVHGEWIYDANGYDYGLPAWKCNRCGCINANIPPRIMTKESKPNYAPVNPNAFSGSNFCPNCGAKMDGEREGE